MAITFMDSFRYLRLEDNSNSFVSSIGTFGWYNKGTTPLLFNDNGVYSLRCSGLGRPLTDSSGTKAAFGFRFRGSARPNVPIVRLLRREPNNNGDPLASLDWPNVLSLTAVGGATYPGAITVILNTDYYVEMEIDTLAKTIKVNLNGYPYISESSVPNLPDNVNELSFEFGVRSTTNNFYYYGDLYIVGNTDGVHKGMVGPQAILDYEATSRSPTSSWSVVPPTKDPVDIVNNLPINTREFTQSNSVGAYDFYQSDGEVKGQVTAVQVRAYLSRTDIDDQKVALGVTYEGQAPALSDDISVVDGMYYSAVFEKDHLDQTWTEESARDTQYGVVVRPR